MNKHKRGFIIFFILIITIYLTLNFMGFPTGKFVVQTSFSIVNKMTPQLIENIPNQTWNQTKNVTIDLGLYFNDTNDMNFTATSISNIIVEMDNDTNLTTLIPDSSFYGTRTVTFTASDGYSSKDSNLVYLTVVQTVPTPPSADTGGGGSGGASVKLGKTNFNFISETITEKFKKSESITSIIIENPTNKILDVELELIGLEGVLELAYDQLKLPSGETIPLTLKFVDEQPEPGIYTGVLRGKSDKIIREINIIIEVGSEKTLFDISLTIPKKYHEIDNGGSLLAEIKLDNKVNKDKNTEVSVDYYIKDLRNNIYYSENEKLIVGDLVNYNKLFKNIYLDEEMGVVGVLVNYEDTTSVSSASFKIKKVKIFDIAIYGTLTLLILIIIGMVILNFISIERIRKLRLKRKR